MTLRLRSAFFVASALIFLWFIYLERAILTPFVLAAIFAYIFNPLINLFTRIRVPRTLSIIFVYIILVITVVYVGSLLTRELIRESENIRQTILDYIDYLRTNIKSLPLVVQPYIATYTELPKIQISTLGLSAFPVFTLAFSGIFNFFIFIFATFFFLKDSEKFVHRLLLIIPDEERLEITALIKKINIVLSKYLRGQVILIISLAIILFAGFSLLGVKNALTIAILSAVAGIVPMIGTIVAIIVGTFIIMVSGGVHNLQLGTFETIGIVVGVYYGAQLIQDYILSPFILGKAVKLHPLVILFAALAGGNLAGIMGLILAVPIAATIKIIFEFALDKINHRDYLLRKGE